MRSKLFFFAVLSIIAISCLKDKTVPVPHIDVPADLIGSWKWLYSTGGYGGVLYTPEVLEQTRKLEFDTENNFRFFINDTLKSETKFHIEKIKSVLSKDSVLVIVAESWLGWQSIKFHSRDTLQLTEEAYDGFDHRYARIR